MPVAHQRGTPAVYVAASARELPADVQEWLGRADTRAVASPHIYDLLAELVRGKRFNAIIVNIQSVDWTEMEFFDIVGRLSRSTPVFVTGPSQQRAKLEAACRRGAHLFDTALLIEELSTEPFAPRLEGRMPVELQESRGAAPEPAPQDDDIADLHDLELPEFEPAATRPAQPAWPRMRLAEPCEQYEPVNETDEFETGFLDDDEPAAPNAAGSVAAESPESPAEESAETEWIVDGPEPTEPDEPEAEPHTLTEQTSSSQTTDAPDRPGAPESLDARAPEAEFPASAPAERDSADGDPPIVFPWTVNPNRPKRTPPPQGAANTESPPPLRHAAEARSAEPPPSRLSDSPFRSVRLTPEEIAALMGRPSRPQTPEAQG